MPKNARDNLAKFFYDCAKVSFAVLVVGNIVRSPLIFQNIIWGGVSTLLFVIFGLIIDFIPTKEK